MTLKEFLDTHPMINQAQLAKALWPSIEYPNTKLANKLAKTAGQRITPKDAKDINNILVNLAKDISDNPIVAD